MAPHWAYVYEHPGSDPARDRFDLTTPAQTTSLVPVEDIDQAVDVVKQLLAEGVELIELCGGFGVADAARIVELVDGRVPVGTVSFAFDSLTQAAAYKARFDAEPAV